MSYGKQTAASFWARVDKSEPDGCWPWTGAVTSTGFGLVSWHGRKVNAHRLAYFLTHREEATTTDPYSTGLSGSDGDRLYLRLHCGNRTCCNPAHISVRDVGARGKLTPEQVRAVRTRYTTENITIAALARAHGVTHGAMSRLLAGKSYAKV